MYSREISLGLKNGSDEKVDNELLNKFGINKRIHNGKKRGGNIKVSGIFTNINGLGSLMRSE